MSTPRKHYDTRAQLNLKISLERMFQLKRHCEANGLSQKEVIEELIGTLCGVPTTSTHLRDTPERYPQKVPPQDIQPSDLIDDREILSIIEFYKAETANEWTPGDQAAIEALNGRVKPIFISAGIIKGLIGSRERVDTFKYCAKTAVQIASDPAIGDGQAYVIDLWRRYERKKESIRRKQRGY